MKKPTETPDEPERKRLTIDGGQIRAENISPNSIPTNMIATGTIPAKLVKVKPTPRERLISIAAAMTFLVLFAILLGALSWVAVKIWADLLSSI